MNKSYLLSALIGAAALSAGISTSAFAATEVYPGTMCIGDKSTDNANIRHGYAGEVFKANTNASTLDCPIVRSSYPYSNVTVYVKDTSVAGNVSCSLMTRSALGTLGSWKDRSSTGVDTASWGQWLDYGAETYSYAGYSYLRCYFPATVAGENIQITDYYITSP